MKMRRKIRKSQPLIFFIREILIVSIVFSSFARAQFPNETLESAFGLLPIVPSEINQSNYLDSLPVIKHEQRTVASESSDLVGEDESIDHISNDHANPHFDDGQFVPETSPENSESTVDENEVELSRGMLNPAEIEKSEKYVSYDSESPDAYRYAPTPDNIIRDYIIPETRWRKIRSEMMYWYFDKGGENGNGDYQTDVHSSMPQIHKNFNFQLPFFGFRYNYTRVSMNGYLEFSDPPEHYTYPLVFPIKDWPKKNDPSFIGIFFSKCRIGALRPNDNDERRPGVYFRQERDLQKRTDQFGVEMRERVKWDIREGVIGAEAFDPKHAVIITWKNMSFSGGIDNSLYRTNTFQMVLATDEVYTYAIFNYLELQWTTHTEAGGDTTVGEGGTPAYIGFNAGNGTRSYEYQPYSQMSTVRDLPSRGWANGFPGRHIFRIDERIMLGTCNKDIANANLDLVFAPESGNMLGGTVVNITGPCFEKTDKIRCLFDTTEVYGTVINRNRAVCVQPRVMAEGYIRFAIAVNNGLFDWKGKYFIETPATATERIFFATRSVHERDPREIKITWDAYNLTSNLNAEVQISVWGYRETTIRPEFEYIDLLERGTTNTGEYIIVPAAYRNRDTPYQLDMQFGFIQINLTTPAEYSGLDITPTLWSKPIPLAWYFGPQWERMYGSKWPQKFCDRWIMNDRYLKNFAAEISLCPCTLEHALNDKGRFLPDTACDKDSNPECFYNKGAIHCVRTGAPNMDGAEQQCCYDKYGFLMLTYDQQWGSKPRRSHNLGFMPWNEANKVPSLSHWFHDIVPIYTCCNWQEEQSVGCETLRFERRPTQDCIAYQSPAVAAVFGDPHFVTFDNVAYTFNGKGEFVLVRVNNEKDKLDVQGRFEQVGNNFYGEVRGTQLTSIVARGNESAIIEVRVRPSIAQWRYRLDVFADKKPIYFDRKSLKFQHFRGVVVYTPTYILNQSEVIIMFDTGAGIEIVENQGYMTARVYLPWVYMNKTKGLMGNWSNDILDDFTLPDGRQVAFGNLDNFESIHKDFAINWLLDDKDDRDKGPALFKREHGRTASHYMNRTYIPEWRKRPEDFLPQNRTPDVDRAHELCGESYQCQYDYAMTLNRDLAHFTKNYHDTLTQIKAINAKRTISCGVLETPRFGRKGNFFFTPGTKVTFECNQDFVLIGDQRRTCMPNGQWDVPEYGYTECLRQIEYSQRTAWATMGIISAVIAPAIVLIAVIFICIKNNKKQDGSTKSWRFSQRTSTIDHDDSLLRHQATPLRAFDRAVSPVSDSSTNTITSIPKPRSYDGVYYTHEPLPNKPKIEFEEKDWDLKEPYSIDGSDSNTDSTRKTASPSKESDV